MRAPLVSLIIVAGLFSSAFPVLAQLGPCAAAEPLCPSPQICRGIAGSRFCFKPCTPPADIFGSAPECISSETCTTPTGLDRNVCVVTTGASGGAFDPSTIDARLTCNESRPCAGETTCVEGTCRQPTGGTCSTDADCRPGASCVGDRIAGRTCNIVAASEETEAPAEVEFVPITPQLGVPIPGFTPDAPTRAEGVVRVAFLAGYINAVYRYLTGIILVIAIVMCVYGGFLYLVGSAGVGSITRGKKIITDAIMGMIITLAAFSILNTVNPATTNLQVLELGFVEREGLESVSSADYVAATGESPPSTSEAITLGREVAVSMGLDPCEAEAVIRGESGGRANAIGYDANVTRAGVFSRRIFIHSGRRYSGSTFTVPPGSWSLNGCRPSSDVTPAQLAAIQDRTIRNDDRFNPSAPPDFGIDDRFSIGIGTFQVTLIPESGSCRLPRCSNGYLGRTVGGTCYSVPELLTPRTQTVAGLTLYQEKRRSCASQSDEYTRLRCAFARYAGSGDSARVSSCNKMRHYSACRRTSHRERENCRSWIGTDDSVANDFSTN